MLNCTGFSHEIHDPNRRPKYRMIFLRTLLREFANLAIAVFLSLFLIALTTRLIRLLGQAAGGKIPSDAVIAFLGFSALNLLPVLLSLTLFITVLLALHRSWRDSEMVIWFNSGLSLAAWAKPVLIFAAPLVLVIAVLAFIISPWAAQKSEQYRSRVDSRDDVSRVEPGAFGESRSKERVFFVESIAGDKSTVQNVFVNSTQHRRTGVMMSERGFLEYAENGDRFLVLNAGRRYEGTPGEADFRLMEFERYATRIQTKEGDEPVATQKSTSTRTGRTFQRRPLRSARAGPFWSPVIPSPRRATHFSPTGCRKRCCGWVYLRIGSSFGSDRTPSINVKPWTR